MCVVRCCPLRNPFHCFFNCCAKHHRIFVQRKSASQNVLRRADFQREGLRLILYPSFRVNSCILTFMELRDVFRSSRDFKHLLDTMPSVIVAP